MRVECRVHHGAATIRVGDLTLRRAGRAIADQSAATPSQGSGLLISSATRDDVARQDVVRAVTGDRVSVAVYR